MRELKEGEAYAVVDGKTIFHTSITRQPNNHAWAKFGVDSLAGMETAIESGYRLAIVKLSIVEVEE